MSKIIGKIKKIDKNYFVIFLIALFVLSPYVSNEFHLGHDSYYHIFNSYSLESSWNFFNTFQIKVLPIIENSFGYGSPIFYPQLSHFLIAFFGKILNKFNINIFYAVKISLFCIVLCSGIFMYKLVLKLLKNKNSALVASVFYMTAPYFLSDLFIRSSYAEAIVFVFIPMVFLSVIYLLEKDYHRFYIWFIIGYVGLINSHLVMTLYITLFLIGVFIVNIKKFLKKDIIISFIKATIIVLLICLPLIIPLLQHKLFGNYAIFYPNYMVFEDVILSCRLKLADFLLINNSSDIGFFLNLFSVILFCISCYNYKKLKTSDNSWLLKASVIMTFITLIVISEIFPWLLMPDVLKFIQFPWRLEVILIFFVCIVSATALLLFDKSTQKILVIICLITSMLYVNQLFLKIDTKQIKAEFFENPIFERALNEYYPMNSVLNIDYIDNRSDDVLVLEGKAKIKILKDKTPYLKFKVSNVSKNTTLELPRIYYFGYKIVQKDNKGKKEILNYSEDKYGMMKVNVSKNSTLEVSYTGTKLSNIGNVISFITIISCFGYLIYIYKKKKTV